MELPVLAGGELQILFYTRHSGPLSKEGFISCQQLLRQGTSVYGVSSEGPLSTFYSGIRTCNVKNNSLLSDSTADALTTCGWDWKEGLEKLPENASISITMALLFLNRRFFPIYSFVNISSLLFPLLTSWNHDLNKFESKFPKDANIK